MIPSFALPSPSGSAIVALPCPTRLGRAVVAAEREPPSEAPTPTPTAPTPEPTPTPTPDTDADADAHPTPTPTPPPADVARAVTEADASRSAIA